MNNLSKIRFLLAIRKSPFSRLLPFFQMILWKSESLFWNYKKARNPSKNFDFDLIDIWLDGYPRSGNTFFRNCLKIAFPEKKILAHLHAPISVISGLKKNIPGILLIREPTDAVVSYSIRTGHSLSSSLSYYINFHSLLEEYIPQLFISDFQSHIKHPRKVINLLIVKFDIPRDKTEMLTDSHLSNQATNLVDKAAKDRFGDNVPRHFVSRPDESRRQLADKYKMELTSSKRLAKKLEKARNLYFEFQKHAIKI